MIYYLDDSVVDKDKNNMSITFEISNLGLKEYE